MKRDNLILILACLRMTLIEQGSVISQRQRAYLTCLVLTSEEVCLS